MVILNGGYYVDELKNLLVDKFGSESINKFYFKNSFFSLKNTSEYINKERVPPLLKTAWNILNRGDCTRASLSLSTYLLNKYFPNNSGFNYSQNEIKTNLNLKNDIDYENLDQVIEQFSVLNEGQVIELGSEVYNIYSCLKKGFLFNQIQKTILLVLMSNPSPTDFKIQGVSNEEADLLISDLNDLFVALNNLSHKEEVKIPLISKNDLNNQIEVSLEGNSKDVIQLLSFIDNHDQSLNFKILTDRQIKYRKLGKVIVSEKILLNGERREEHKFEYQTKKQENALSYFLQNIFRKSKYRPGQEAIINRALLGKDVIGLLPTGGGKSLTFQICALLHPGVTIVVDPINSLMKDQYDKLIDNGINNASFINSFNSKDEREGIIENLTASKYLFLFVSPERFQMQNFRGALGSCNDLGVYFSYAVIDEAHCVSEWGHDFRHVYLNLANNLKFHCKPRIGNLTVYGLTATASFDVLADVQRELNLNEDAIISLPAEAIDRAELNYKVVSIPLELEEGLDFYEREQKLGQRKYPVIKNLLREMPNEIRKLEKSYGYINSSTDFYEKIKDRYQNAGVIFCPTKSNKLPNGVVHLSYGRDEGGGGLSDLKFIELTTFFGGGNDDVIKDDAIEKKADKSYENQEDFIKNKANLMVATKAFGMGIDKPNIRYSVHYAFPNSVESFYQEAGRAGRDGNPSLCTIIYSSADLEMNYDFYQNAFKGVKRERLIIDELLNEVQYEDGFFINLLKQKIQSEYADVRSLNLHNDRYIYINGQWHDNPEERITIGVLDLDRNLKSYDNATKNFDSNRATEILNFARQALNELCDIDDYLNWFKTKSSDGIKTLIDSQQNENYFLKIGFTNGIVSKMNEVVKSIGYNDFEERIIRAAYNFSSNEDEFIDALQYQYYKFQKNKGNPYPNSFSPNPDTVKYLKDNFLKIRNSQDTQKAIYRLNILGIIDDYVIDYSAKLIEVRFKAKSDKQYLSNFKAYLRRYLGIETTKYWINKVDNIEGDSMLTKVLYVLIEFIDQVISDKRKLSIDYMKELCEVYLEEGENEFRERMIRYFTSKYARQDYLPKDTEKGTLENSAIVRKYIGFIDRPPDGLGGQIDNAKHLRGACDNLRINMSDNASIDLLTAFSLFALELREDDTIYSAKENPLIAKAIGLYRAGFKRLLQLDTWKEVKELIDVFNNKTLDFNSEIRPLLEDLSSEILINRTNYKLKAFLNNIT